MCAYTEESYTHAELQTRAKKQLNTSRQRVLLSSSLLFSSSLFFLSPVSHRVHSVENRRTESAAARDRSPLPWQNQKWAKEAGGGNVCVSVER